MRSVSLDALRGFASPDCEVNNRSAAMPTRTEVPATATPASPSATTPGNDEEGGGGISGGSIASQSQSVSPDAADAAAASGSPPPTNVNRHSQSQSDEDDHEANEDDDGLLFSCRCESARSVTTLLSCLRHVASGGGGSGTSDFALTQGALAAGRRSRADLSLSAIDHTGISGGRGGGIGGGGGGRGGSGRAQHATVFAGEAGLTFHVHGTARQSQASVDMQSGLFSDYYVCEQVVEVDDDDDDNDDGNNEAEGGGTRTKTEVVKGGEFCINLTTVLECLHVLGTNALDRTKLCLSYDLHDAIFRIELLEETHGATGGGIVSTCAIPGLAVSDDYDDEDEEDGEGGTGASGLAIAFRSCPIVARAIVKSDYLRDAVVELSDVPGAASATIGISPRGMDLAAVGFSTECQVSLPHAGNDAVFVSLDCDPPRLHARTYPLHSILSAFRGLEIASETCISINRRGMVAIQHQVLDEHVGNGQPNFVDFIMGCLQDDDGEDSDDDGYGDEEDDVVVELGREMLTSGTQRSIEEARRRRRRGRHQQQAATATGTAGTGTYASSDEGEDEEAKRRETEDMLKRLGNESSSDEEDGEGGRTKKSSKTKDGESEYAQLTMEPTSKSSSRSQRDHERKNRGRRNRGGAKKKASVEDDDENNGTEDESDSDEFKKFSKRKKKGRKEKKKRSDGRGRKRPSPTTNSGRSKSRRKKSDGDDEANASSDSPSRSPRDDEESEPETDVDSQFYKIGGGNAASNAAQDPPSSPELMYGNTSLVGPSTSMIESRKSVNFDDDSDGSF